MKATHRFRDSKNKTIGFYIDGQFYNLHYTKKNISRVENLIVTKNGVFRPKTKLHEVDYRSTIIRRQYNKLVKSNPFKRDIQNELVRWKKTSSRVLCLDGARRCGKTTELLRFAYRNYEKIIYINLAGDRLFNEIFDGAVKRDVMKEYCEQRNLPEYTDNRNTILIIDEIQQSSDIWNQLEVFNEQLRCDIAVSGSYLGRTVISNTFFKLATVERHTMHTLSFSEFCMVFGKEALLKSISLYGESDDSIYKQLDELYNIYIQIGGYPDVIMEYKRSKDIGKCLNIVGSILEVVDDESAVYMKAARDKMIFTKVYRAALLDMIKNKRGTGKYTTDYIVETLTRENQRYVINRTEILDAVAWLKYCKLIEYIDMVNDGHIDDICDGRRMYFRDCGVLNYIAANTGLLAKYETNIRGLLAETFVYNELLRLVGSKILKYGNICFSIYGNYELDFMFTDSSQTVYGIEVKSNKGSHKSLSVCLDKGFIDKGIIANNSKGGISQKFRTIPIYTVASRFPYR